MVAKEIVEKGEPKSAICALIQDIREVMKAFRYVEMKLTRREGNRAVHLLAAHARVSEDLRLIGNAPDYVQEQLQQDCHNPPG